MPLLDRLLPKLSDNGWSSLCWAYTFACIGLGAVLGLTVRWLLSFVHVTLG